MLPVDVQTFVESPYFLNRRGILYPAVMEELRELNSGKYVEAVLTGAFGRERAPSPCSPQPTSSTFCRA